MEYDMMFSTACQWQKKHKIFVFELTRDTLLLILMDEL